jgi:hypothetical protein
VFLGLRKEIKLTNLFLLEHFQHFPREVQLGLQSGDSRYLRNYWKTPEST